MARILALLLLLALAGACRSAPPRLEQLTDGRFEVRLEGNHSYRDRRLHALLAPGFREFDPGESFRALVDDAAYVLERFYREEGWADAVVESSVDESQEPAVGLIKIQEGARVRIGAIDFEGNSAYDSEELAAFFLPRREGLFSRPRHWFVRRDVSTAVESVRAFYAANGWLDAAVRSADVESTGEGVVDLRVNIEEGVRYHLRDVQLQGGVEEVDRRVELEDQLGSPYSRRTGRVLQGRIVEAYARRGWPDVQASVAEVDRQPDGDVALLLTIEPGERVRISEVRAQGMERTSAGFVLRNLELEAGELYDVQKERRSFRNLYRTGIFSSVRIALEPDHGEERALVVSVEEAPSTELYVEPGYGSYERLRLGAGWRQKNLFGSGRIFDADARVAELAQRVELTVTDGRFLGSELIASLSLFADRREEPSFLREEVGSNFALSRDLGARWRATASYQYRLTFVEADDISDPTVQAALADTDISSLGLSAVYDSRDSRFLPPTRGRRMRGGVDVASALIGSQVDFVRLRFGHSWFTELFRGTVLALDWRTGWIVPIADTDVIPIQERFFSGGENTVRAFREDRLGPRDMEGNVIGGEALNVWNLELRQHLRGALHGAVFFDAGNVVGDRRDYLDFPDVRYGPGVGLRYLLPVGPIRLDLGWNVEPEENESELVLHFSVGMAF